MLRQATTSCACGSNPESTPESASRAISSFARPSIWPHIADGEQRLYLGGYPASKVSNRNVSTDSFLTMIDLHDHWATFAELLLADDPIELSSVTSPTYGEVNPTGVALVDG